MRISTPVRPLIAAAPLIAFIITAHTAQAQVETIDPNPTMPRDVGGRLTYRGASGGGLRLGRTTGGEENPAETLLKSIEGTHYGRATGHSIFSRDGSPRARGNSARRPLRSPDPSATMFFAQRGASEDRVYYPANGSHRAVDRQQSQARARPEQNHRHTVPNVTGKVYDGRRPMMRPAPR